MPPQISKPDGVRGALTYYQPQGGCILPPIRGHKFYGLALLIPAKCGLAYCGINRRVPTLPPFKSDGGAFILQLSTYQHFKMSGIVESSTTFELSTLQRGTILRNISAIVHLLFIFISLFWIGQVYTYALDSPYRLRHKRNEQEKKK